ncbi:DUF2637 domain-containing protein [Nocardiopsis ganjiahuensis]|uniref:DUF2637 domain-containing protein n=1 Tax=Nocardiopsis ganjiahuensis TaxID=239984 RepID=UPI00034D54A4|nr:DUF2637 domain-containing protein [Nocardiopsis ganjiahuensis]
MSNPSTPTKKLSDGQITGLGLAVIGMLAVGVYGLVISYWTVRELAERLHMPLPALYPIGIEGGMVAVLAIDIVLTWIGRPIGWLRQVARILAGTAIGINAYAGMEHGPAAIIMHALAPAILIVGVEALRHHLLVLLEVPEEREPIPRGRWLLAPLSTVAMWRRMILWQQPKYGEALDTHLDRHEALAELKRAFGWRWKKRIPAGLAYRLSVGVRLEQSTREVRELLAEHYARMERMDARTVQLMDEHTPTVYAHDVTEWHEPVRVPLAPGVHAIVGGDRVDGYLSPGGRPLLPIECAARAQEHARALAEGQAAVAKLKDWQARERVAGVRTRMHTEAVAVAAGGAPRALPYSSRTQPNQRTHPSARTQEIAAHTAPEPARTQPAVERPAVVTERLPGAAVAKKKQGARTRERIVAHMEQHPTHTAEEIAAHVGVTASTVRRHQTAMRAQERSGA